ncbi:hypothetical protein CBR_g57658 [Chara braunii]|uniref:RNA helicase n=1 Tax=Chara braunii TaxID=69332 RepID=A0A388MEB3_CHABU|nr:hypothetical protein CBR_g57658 [Chara braunii]|eukprot:GBG92900.1 hypothetical protein CBR_g57658 [Chara braunii]
MGVVGGDAIVVAMAATEVAAVDEATSAEVAAADEATTAEVAATEAILTMPGESLSMDFMDTLVTSKSGKRHIFVIVDRFSKYARLVAMPETTKIEYIIKMFKENWVRDFGLPKSIVSDRDVRFTSELWKAAAAEQGTQLQMTSGNHPEANGQAEQLNHAVQHLLRHYIKPNQVDWDEKLALIASLYNNVVRSATGGFSLAVSRQSCPGSQDDPGGPVANTGRPLSLRARARARVSMRVGFEKQGINSTTSWRPSHKEKGDVRTLASLPLHVHRSSVPCYVGANPLELSLLTYSTKYKFEGQLLRRPPQISPLVSYPSLRVLLRRILSGHRCCDRCFSCSATIDDEGRSVVVSNTQSDVEGGDVDSQCQDETLSELLKDQVPEWLLKRVQELGFVTPTSVQREALPAVFSGRDCIIHAQTGSGKTLVYLMPLIANIDTRRSAVQALVVVPTRELGMQVAKVARLLGGGSRGDDSKEREGGDACSKPATRRDSKRFSVMTALEGTGAARVKGWLKAEPPQLVVGMPERLLQMINDKTLRTNALQYVVVDEVDAVLERMKKSRSSHLHQLLTMAGSCSRRQTLLVSATVPQHHHFASYCIQNKWAKPDLLHIHVEPEEKLPTHIKHRYIICAEPKRLEMLDKLIASDKPRAAIVFGNEQSEKGKRSGALPPAQVIAQYLSENKLVFPHVIGSTNLSLEKNMAVSISSGTSEAQNTTSARSENQEPRMKGRPVTEGQEWDEEFGSTGISANVLDEETDETWRPLLLTDDADANARVSVLDEFRRGARRLLVTTDFAGRGLDIPSVSHVYNFDLPSSAIAYVHRGGRTGRDPFGREQGIVTSFATNKEVFVLKRLWNELQIAAEEVNLN